MNKEKYNERKLQLFDALKKNGRMSPSDVCSALNITKAYTWVLLSRTSKRNYVEKQREGRYVFYSLSDKGCRCRLRYIEEKKKRSTAKIRELSMVIKDRQGNTKLRFYQQKRRKEYEQE